MRMNLSKNEWKVPNWRHWHPDYGDPGIEFEMLKSFCTYCVEKKELTFYLDWLEDEEGYMYVYIYYNNKEIGYLNIVNEKGKLKFGYFSELQEVYFDTNEAGFLAISKDINNI